MAVTWEEGASAAQAPLSLWLQGSSHRRHWCVSGTHLALSCLQVFAPAPPTPLPRMLFSEIFHGHPSSFSPPCTPQCPSLTPLSTAWPTSTVLPFPIVFKARLTIWNHLLIFFACLFFVYPHWNVSSISSTWSVLFISVPVASRKLGTW